MNLYVTYRSIYSIYRNFLKLAEEYAYGKYFGPEQLS
jgi:hypothetical protein